MAARPTKQRNPEGNGEPSSLDHHLPADRAGALGGRTRGLLRVRDSTVSQHLALLRKEAWSPLGATDKRSGIRSAARRRCELARTLYRLYCPPACGMRSQGAPQIAPARRAPCGRSMTARRDRRKRTVMAKSGMNEGEECECVSVIVTVAALVLLSPAGARPGNFHRRTADGRRREGRIRHRGERQYRAGAGADRRHSGGTRGAARRSRRAGPGRSDCRRQKKSRCR